MSRQRKPFGGKRNTLARAVIESRRRRIASKASMVAWSYKRGQSELASFEAMGYLGETAQMNRRIEGMARAANRALSIHATGFDYTALDSVVMWGVCLDSRTQNLS